MTKQRRQFSSEFKFQLAQEAVRNVKTVSQIASEYGVHLAQGGERLSAIPVLPPGPRLSDTTLVSAVCGLDIGANHSPIVHQVASDNCQICIWPFVDMQ